MNIAVLSAANSIHTVKIVNGLAALGHKVTLFSLPSHRDVDSAVSQKVDLQYLPKKGYAANGKPLAQALCRCGAEILYAHYATGYGTLARKAKFHPTVLAVWGSDVYDFPKKGPIHSLLVRKNLGFADAVFSTSRCMALITNRYTHKPITVTPFGVDLTEFCPVKKKESETVTFGFLKGVSEKYGISDLLHAYELLRNDHPTLKTKLSVYGDGDQLVEMKQFCQEHGLDSVTFFGRIPHAQAAAALQTMDVFCVPSTLDSESFGVSAVEAMACGLPVIASDVDGLSEVTKDGVTGYTVARKNVLALKNAMADLCLNREKRFNMGIKARKRVETRYNWQDNIRHIQDSLQSVLNMYQ